MDSLNNLIKDVRKNIKDNFFHQIEEKLKEHENVKILIFQKEKIQKEINKYDNYIDGQLTFIQDKISELQQEFTLKEMNDNIDSVLKFELLNSIENEILSSYSRNKIHYHNIQKLYLLVYKIQKNILDEGGFNINSSAKDKKQLEKLINEEDLVQDLKSIEEKFSLYISLYEEVMKVLRSKGYLIRNVVELLKFNSGNI